jgi:tetratricopeptide (TPR) repeat protein
MSDTVVELVRRADCARQENRLADAHQDWMETVAICRQTGARRELVRALRGLGQIERDIGRGDAARPLYEEAVTICHELGDPLALAHTVRHLGDIHMHAGRVDLAEACYHEALAQYPSREDNPPLDLANALRPLAILKHDAGDVQEARRLFEEARNLYAAAAVQEGVDGYSAWLARLSR